MDAKLRCSNCGAEITNLTLSWGRKQWLYGFVAFIPALLFFWWWQSLFFHTHDFAGEIQTTLLDTRFAADRVDVLGKLKNVGTHTWDRVTIQAEFYDGAGKFLDESSEYLSVTLSPQSEENFRVTLATSNQDILKGKPKVVLRVTGADEKRF